MKHARRKPKSTHELKKRRRRRKPPWDEWVEPEDEATARDERFINRVELRRRLREAGV